MNQHICRLALVLFFLSPLAAFADADLSLSGSADATAVAGENLLYELTVFNAGPDTATDVVINDVLPAGVTLLGDSLDACSVTATAADGQQTIQCDLGSLDQFDLAELNLLTLVEHDFLQDRGVTSAVNTPQVSTADTDPNPDNDSDTISTVIEAVADLDIQLFSNVAVVPAGETFTYVIIVENNGPSTASNLVIQDTLVASEFVRANGCSIAVRTEGGLTDQFDCNFALSVGVFDLGTMGSNWLNPRGAVCDWNAGALPGEEEICNTPTDRDLGRIIITLNLTANEATTLNSFADVISDTPDSNPDNNAATIISRFDAVADLGVTKTALTPSVNGGETASWEVVVTNHGPSVATNVELIDYLPSALLDGTVAMEGSVYDDTDVLVGPVGCTTGTPGDPDAPARCDLGGMPEGYTAEVTVSGIVRPDYLDQLGLSSVPIVNNVEVVSDTFDAVLDGACSVWPCPPAPDEPNFDNAAVIVGESADLRLDKFAIGAPIAGEVFHYEFDIRNDGPSVARDVSLRDFLPDGVEFLDASVDLEGGSSFEPLPCTIAQGSNVLFCPLGDIPITGTVPIFAFVNVRIDPTVPQGTVLTNRADVLLSDTADPDTTNNRDSVDVLVQTREPRALVISKTAMGEMLQPGMIALGVDVSDPPPFPEAPNYAAEADRVNAGRRIRYSIDVTNTSTNSLSGDALNVTVTDNLPAGLEVVPGSLVIEYSPGGAPEIPLASCSLGTPGNPADPLRCGLGRLGEIGDPQYPNQVSIQFDVIVDSSFTENTVITNNVAVTSTSEELDNSGSQASNQTIVRAPENDAFTEFFDPGTADLQSWLLELTPDGSTDFYSAETCPIGLQLPVPSEEGKQVLDGMADDDSIEIVLADGKQVLLYGIKYGSIYIGSNGYVTLGSPDTSYNATLGSHFEYPRFSALFTDLNPAAGGEVWWVQREDRVVISWSDIPSFLSDTTNRVTMELLFNGVIRIWYRKVDEELAIGAVSGLSSGDGIPDGFVESDIVQGEEAYPVCGDIIFFDDYEIY